MWGASGKESDGILRLSAVKETLDEGGNFARFVGEVGTEGAVAVGAELVERAVDGGGRKDAVRLEDVAALLETIGRGGAAVGQLGKALHKFGLIGGVDVDIDVGGACHFEGIGHFKAVASRHANAGQQLIDVGRTVGIADLHRLFAARVAQGGGFERIGFATHVDIARPPEGNAHQHGAVAVAPAHIGGGFLVRHETEIRSGVLVAESREGGGEIHESGNETTGVVAQFASVVEHEVVAVAGDAHVHMESRTGLAGGDLRGEGDVEPFFVGEVTDDPLRNDELVSGFTDGNGEKLNLVLLIDQPILGEIAHFGVAVLDLRTGLGDGEHALGAEGVGFGKGCRFVVGALVDSGIAFFVGFDDVVLEFAHSFELHAGDFAEGFGGLEERLLGGGSEGASVFVEIGAEQTEGGDLGEGIDKGGREARQHIEVAAAGADEAEEARSVYALAAAEEGVEIGAVGDDEIERFEASVAGGIEEIDHADAVFGNVAHDVGLGEFTRRLLEVGHEGVGVEEEIFVVHDTEKLGGSRCAERWRSGTRVWRVR